MIRYRIYRLATSLVPSSLITINHDVIAHNNVALFQFRLLFSGEILTTQNDITADEKIIHASLCPSDIFAENSKLNRGSVQIRLIV